MQSELRTLRDEKHDQPAERLEAQLHELYPKLRRYCRFLTRNTSDWEDIAQETLAKAWQQYRYQPQVTAALLNKIAHNVWIDTVRKRSRELLEEMPGESHPETSRIDDHLEAVQQLMNRLTPKQAVVFALKEGFRFQLSEIAELLNTSEPAVKAAIHRAKQRLAAEETDTVNPLIEQYWETADHQEIERILQEAFRTQDPTILIGAIPSIRSLAKDTGPVCSVHGIHHARRSSATVYLAA
ncbi:sigma-70 family RNA polymerase sigma factor [Planococcus lenghuensis]|uniref:sigma-70 family RNA polymerase sigma factor n=1 Tax=Planococcus lenghuensis TaxID=2213202 RepID=UPI0018DE755F|nr:sigma-70 family RNA polymerase sigma factor [Planococcus lenghuensis]